jgi:hypothetical protein
MEAKKKTNREANKIEYKIEQNDICEGRSHLATFNKTKSSAFVCFTDPSYCPNTLFLTKLTQQTVQFSARVRKYSNLATFCSTDEMQKAKQ